MHRYSCAITLTYDDQHLPQYGNLLYDHFQAFIKRTRKAAFKRGEIAYDIEKHASALIARRYGGIPHTPGETDPGIKFYMAGEYTEANPEEGYPGGRPHFHALLFGMDFHNKLYHSKSPAGTKIYISPELMQLWPYGYSSVGEVNFESAAYIARYIMKKQTGNADSRHYEIYDPETGEIIKKRKEFNQMSRRQGIGSTWLEKYSDDVYNSGKIIMRGHKHNPPRYYDKRYQKVAPELLDDLKYARLLESIAQREHHTPARLAVQEQVQTARTSTLKRNLK